MNTEHKINVSTVRFKECTVFNNIICTPLILMDILIPPSLLCEKMVSGIPFFFLRMPYSGI
jgi:hypothetical protein